MPNIKVLVVAGGGGGGAGTGGGGGGGGYVYNSAFNISAGAYTVTVGDGGTGVTSAAGNNGENSVFSTITSVGGGGGATNSGNGANGGCGGGAGAAGSTGGTGSQGANGGTGSGSGPGYGAGGGGGATSNGVNGGASSGGNGGAGTSNTILDDSTDYYSGGGGGGVYITGTGGTGGNGGGGNAPAGAGTANTGGGGGGQKSNFTTAGGKGGSGIVIIRYATADFGTCTGGSEKFTIGSETVHKFVLADSGTSMTFVSAVTAPTVTTQAASSVLSTSFTGNGNITATGGANATRRGFCYLQGSSGDPTVANSVAYDDGDYSTGAYTKSITGLSAGTAYRVRAYAVNSAGTSYGATVDVTTATATSGNFFQFFLVLLAITLLTGCGVKNTEPLGEVIVEQQVKEPIVIQPKIIPVLTSTQKATLSTLVTKSSATATSKNKMTYQEALDYVKALNDQTVTREFKDKGLKDVMPVLKNEFQTKLIIK